MNAAASSASWIVGFDLGHGETSVALAPVKIDSDIFLFEPWPGIKSWVTAYLARTDGIEIGKKAIAAAGPNEHLYLAFKAAPDGNVDAAVRSGERTPEYASAVIKRLLHEHPMLDGSFEVILGCPSSWHEGPRRTTAMQAYEHIIVDRLTQSDLRGIPLTVVPESRAAMMEVLQLNSAQSHDRTLENTLVVDLGSLTLDLTYVHSLNEPTENVNPQKPEASRDSEATAGGARVAFDLGYDLGAGHIDVALFRNWQAKERGPVADLVSRLQRDDVAYTKILHSCRIAKERLFSDCEGDTPTGKEFGEGSTQFETEGGAARFRIEVGLEEMRAALDAPLDTPPRLDRPVQGSLSWSQAFNHCLADARARLGEQQLRVQHVIIVGGASRMYFVPPAVRRAFPEAKVYRLPNPELVVAQGLSRWGRRRWHTRAFERTMADAMRTALSRILDDRFPEYINTLSTQVAQAVVDGAILPEFKRWRNDTGYSSLESCMRGMAAAAERWLLGDGPRGIRIEATSNFRRRIESAFLDLEVVKDACQEHGIHREHLKAEVASAEDGADATINIPLNDSQRIIQQKLEGLFGSIITAITGFIVVGLLHIPIFGWLIAAVAAIVGARELVLKADLWVSVRQAIVTDAKLRDIRNEIIKSIDGKVRGALNGDKSAITALKDSIGERVAQRIQRAVDRELLLRV